jgi:hypothetical protein
VDERLARVAQLRTRLQELRAEFTNVEGEYRAGRISLNEEVTRLTEIARETSALVDAMTALAAGTFGPPYLGAS